MSGYVYFALCAGRIKVGTSIDVHARLKDISAHLFDELSLITKVPGGSDLEHAIHRKLRKHRLRNEWFSDCPEVRAVMADVVARGTDAVEEFYRPTDPYPRAGLIEILNPYESKIDVWIIELRKIADIWDSLLTDEVRDRRKALLRERGIRDFIIDETFDRARRNFEEARLILHHRAAEGGRRALFNARAAIGSMSLSVRLTFAVDLRRRPDTATRYPKPWSQVTP